MDGKVMISHPSLPLDSLSCDDRQEETRRIWFSCVTYFHHERLLCRWVDTVGGLDSYGEVARRARHPPDQPAASVDRHTGWLIQQAETGCRYACCLHCVTVDLTHHSCCERCRSDQRCLGASYHIDRRQASSQAQLVVFVIAPALDAITRGQRTGVYPTGGDGLDIGLQRFTRVICPDFFGQIGGLSRNRGIGSIRHGHHAARANALLIRDADCR